MRIEGLASAQALNFMKILRSIIAPDKTYKPGMESEVERDFTAEQIAVLVKRGALAGVFATETGNKPVTSTTPKRCAFIKADGEQCGNDAVKNSEFCHIKSHR